MRIMQVFRSARDNHVISELEMAGASPTTPIPIVETRFAGFMTKASILAG